MAPPFPYLMPGSHYPSVQWLHLSLTLCRGHTTLAYDGSTFPLPYAGVTLPWRTMAPPFPYLMPGSHYPSVRWLHLSLTLCRGHTTLAYNGSTFPLPYAGVTLPWRTMAPPFPYLMPGSHYPGVQWLHLSLTLCRGHTTLAYTFPLPYAGVTLP